MSRNYGLDIFRIMCCLGVLNYHVMDDVLQIGGAYVLYYGSSFCVPGFFLLSGYLLSGKKAVSIQYIEDKIASTIVKLFGWIIFWAIIHFACTGEYRDIWNDFTAGVGAGGTLPVSWFLFTYMFILILAYPLSAMQNKYESAFNVLAITWFLLLAVGFGKSIVISRPQSLWIHLYAGYFIVGMLLHKLESRFMERKSAVIIVSAIILVLSSAVYAQNYQVGAPHQHYGTWYYSAWLISLFMVLTNVRIQNIKIGEIIKRIGGNTFSVYLGHLPLLLWFTGIRPLRTLSEAVCMVIFLFISMEVLSEVFKRLPVLQKIV